MKSLKNHLHRFLEGTAPHDLRQKIFQVILEYKESVIDLLTLAIPQIIDINPNFIDILHCPDNEIVRQGSLNFRIWSVNVNDPGLTNLSREKPIMALLILERLRKKNLSEAEALRIVDDALVVIHAINEEGVYEQMVKLEALLIAVNYPENREIIDKLVDKLSRDPHYEKQSQQVKEIKMMYSEQLYNEGQEKGVRHAVLKAAQARFDSDPAIMELVNNASSDTLDELLTLIVRSSSKEDLLQTFKPSQH